MNPKIPALINALNLQAHPEGGYYRETYRSTATVNFGGARNVATCIYFLLTENNFSAFHRIRQDEIWHFYAGSVLTLHTISPQGAYTCIAIGNNLEAGEVPQYVVQAGTWFAAEVKADYALVGCTVAPGFDFRDFELADRTRLTETFPGLKQLIERLTRV